MVFTPSDVIEYTQQMSSLSSGFFPGYKPLSDDLPPGMWFLFQEEEPWFSIVTPVREDHPRIPLISDFARTKLKPSSVFYIGSLDDQPCYTGVIGPESTLTDGYQLTQARSLYGIMDRGTEEGLSRARGIVHWDATSRYCGRCGSETAVGSAEPVRKCPSCGLSSYPQINPAVIILIVKEEKILLAHNRRFPENLYSCVAGFVETGETLEDAVRREIWEETGIEVAHLRYFGNQPWPFPSSLMIAFLADYAGGSITLEDEDITDAKWFSRDNLPDLPLHGSISREMIDWFTGNGVT